MYKRFVLSLVEIKRLLTYLLTISDEEGGGSYHHKLANERNTFKYSEIFDNSHTKH
jgi:hypothetical protein